MGQGEAGQPVFFVSYTQVDREWAEWIAWYVEYYGFRTLVQAWDSKPGSHWPQDMDAALRSSDRTIAVLSDAYLRSLPAAAEWQATWTRDPDGSRQKLLPVRVSACRPSGLLGGVVSVDLFGIDEEAALGRLRDMLASTVTDRMKPGTAPRFPGDKRSEPPPPFPGGSAVTTGETEGGGVAYMSDYRQLAATEPDDSLDDDLLRDRIMELTESAELVSQSYSADSPRYVVTRRRIHGQLEKIKGQLELISQWLDASGGKFDLSTFDLRYSLDAYYSAAGEFANMLDRLESAPSASSKLAALARYESSSRRLRDVLWQTHREFSAVWQDLPGRLR